MGRHSAENKKIIIFIIFFIIIIGLISVGICYFKNETNDKYSIQNVIGNNTESNKENAIENNIQTNKNETNDTNETKDEVIPSIEENNESNELFYEYYSKAEELLKTMTLEEKVGQMFLARYPESDVISEIQNHNPGGYILFGRDFDNKTKESMLEELTNCQENSKIKLALGVDEEGGTVVRVSSHKAFRSSKFLSPQSLWAKGQLPLILQDSKEKSELLKSIGLNMNLTPVADVPTSSSDFIYKRSYGRRAEKTAIYVARLITTMNESGMISTMKHFPGYGNNVDTHTGIAVDERPFETFENSDFLPFKSGIEAKGPTILVSHNIVKCMDSEKPASLSENVHKILRENLGFSGIIMTDDLAMDAVKTYVQNGEAALQAVIAGNDMIISSDFVAQKQEVLNAINEGKIKESTINNAVKRILAWKYAYKII